MASPPQYKMQSYVSFQRVLTNASLYLLASDNLVSSLQIKTEMENQLSVPMADGGRKSETQVISEVLSRNTAKPSLFQNVALLRSSGSKMSDLAADLEIEKRGSAELLETVNTQRDETNELTRSLQEAEKNQADMHTRIDELKTKLQL